MEDRPVNNDYYMHTIDLIPFDESLHLNMIESLTALLHKAYAPLAEKGLRYLATARTLKRLKDGAGFIAFDKGQLIGTVTLYPPKQNEISQHYRKKKVY